MVGKSMIGMAEPDGANRIDAATLPFVFSNYTRCAPATARG